MTCGGRREVTRAKYCISLRRPVQGMEPWAPMPMLRLVAATISVSSGGCIFPGQMHRGLRRVLAGAAGSRRCAEGKSEVGRDARACHFGVRVTAK